MIIQNTRDLRYLDSRDFSATLHFFAITSGDALFASWALIAEEGGNDRNRR
jgi:hypothetical protein